MEAMAHFSGRGRAKNHQPVTEDGGHLSFSSLGSHGIGCREPAEPKRRLVDHPFSNEIIPKWP